MEEAWAAPPGAAGPSGGDARNSHWWRAKYSAVGQEDSGEARRSDNHGAAMAVATRAAARELWGGSCSSTTGGGSGRTEGCTGGAARRGSSEGHGGRGIGGGWGRTSRVESCGEIVREVGFFSPLSRILIGLAGWVVLRIIF
jgi:hypothetical protein